ncbi:MAG: class I SAM-dependent methyltransferase [Actinomycetota bacterium]
MRESSNPDRFSRHAGPGPRTDWVAWHEAYDSPTGSLARRLERVRIRLAEALDAIPHPATVLSLCAGDGRDLLGAELAVPPARAVLVELDRELATRASEAAAGQTWAEVRCADASDRAVFADVLPVDVLMACGILGNVDPDAVPVIARGFAGLLAPGGVVIWTRGSGEPDRRADVRTAFVEAGFEELAFDGADDVFGVGVGRLADPVPEAQVDAPLFVFVR